MNEIGKMVCDLCDNIEARYNTKSFTYGIPTDFYAYDNFLGGIHKSELTIVAGRHSMGKT